MNQYVEPATNGVGPFATTRKGSGRNQAPHGLIGNAVSLTIVSDVHGNQGGHEEHHIREAQVRLRTGSGCHSWFPEPATEQLS